MKDFSLRDFLLGGVVFTAVLNALGKRRYGLLIFLILVTVILTILYLVYRIIKFLLFEVIPAVIAGLKEGVEESRKMFADMREEGVPVQKGAGASVKRGEALSSSSLPGSGLSTGRRTCPQCAESIKAAARVCRYCRFEL